MLPSGARAQGVDFATCNTLPQQGMNACYAEEAIATQRVLDSVLAAVRVRVGRTTYPGFQRVQAAWATYVSTECARRANQYKGGSILPAVHATCLIEHRWDRIDELRANLCDGDNRDGCGESRRFARPQRWRHSDTE
jgi:uncharacterized protein YecT (DUF1311 family)